MPTLPRRSFLRHSTAFAATAASLHLTSGVRAQSPNSKFTVGLIGPGGMGTGHLRQLAKTEDVNFAYVCDVDQTRLAAAVKNVEAAGRPAPKAVGDLRRIAIGTPVAARQRGAEFLRARERGVELGLAFGPHGYLIYA